MPSFLTSQWLCMAFAVLSVSDVESVCIVYRGASRQMPWNMTNLRMSLGMALRGGVSSIVGVRTNGEGLSKLSRTQPLIEYCRLRTYL